MAQVRFLNLAGNIVFHLLGSFHYSEGFPPSAPVFLLLSKPTVRNAIIHENNEEVEPSKECPWLDTIYNYKNP